MLLTVGVSLYTTRIVLDSLGATDYGIFVLIGGVIAMLSFLNNAMATSTQRFLSFFQTEKNHFKLKQVFYSSLILHFFIGLLVVIVLEVLGLFLLDNVLSIPADRIKTARIIYHYMAATVFFQIITVPFTASLIAHENMLWVAMVNVLEVILKLGIALLLLVISTDKLLIFGVLTASITFVSFLLYSIYCLKKYEECSLKFNTPINKPLIKELVSFAGFNLFGSLCYLGRSQGLAIIFNLFLGTVVNAAYGIANQVSGQLLFFSTTLLRALNPQIMKSEGNGDRARMLRLSMIASKFSLLLLALFVIPGVFEMKFILGIWLKEIPPYAISFCSFLLVAILINQLTIGLQSALQATGKIKVYQTIVGSLIMLTPVVAYACLYFGFPPSSVFFAYIAIELLACYLRIYFSKKFVGLKTKVYFERVIYRSLLPLMLAVISCFAITSLTEGLFRVVLTLIASTCSILIGSYFLGLCLDEKKIIDDFVNQLVKKVRNKGKIVYQNF